jgi:hypothetical protein
VWLQLLEHIGALVSTFFIDIDWLLPKKLIAWASHIFNTEIDPTYVQLGVWTFFALPTMPLLMWMLCRVWMPTTDDRKKVQVEDWWEANGIDAKIGDGPPRAYRQLAEFWLALTSFGCGMVKPLKNSNCPNQMHYNQKHLIPPYQPLYAEPRVCC